MKTITKVRRYEEIVFIANDGKEFSCEEKCRFYEWTLTATPVYVVSERGQRDDSVEVYSTYEKAEKAVGYSTVHTITQTYLNERLWNE